jgi:hypothetical protein
MIINKKDVITKVRNMILVKNSWMTAIAVLVRRAVMFLAH